MNLKKNAYPNFNNKECGLILLSEWIGEESDLIKSTDAAMDEVETSEWPDGLISYSCLMSKDKQKVLHCVQWKSQEDHLNYVEKQLPERLHKLESKIKVKSHQSFGRFKLKESHLNETKFTPQYILISPNNEFAELKDKMDNISDYLLKNIDSDTYMTLVEFTGLDNKVSSKIETIIYSLLRSYANL